VINHTDYYKVMKRRETELTRKRPPSSIFSLIQFASQKGAMIPDQLKDWLDVEIYLDMRS